ncbi:aldehyde dehydrogenase family protein [Verticiella sediminum]|uniref:Aldehyde dehydrogenase family protein n=1 Tax=Verticiella sediminum TaxID=1247510 RepID=A0A556ABW6_9BURK|nr:aldehyde dehydrogenase family protein [Verticiella sediminum]TSH90384.1 aldehyde dehydrogenase family protein [Verticiella sediminum]
MTIDHLPADAGYGATAPPRYDLFYGGRWHPPVTGKYEAVIAPATGAILAHVACAGQDDVDLAVAAAQAGFAEWQSIPALERARRLRGLAADIRDHAEELAHLDAMDSGNPVWMMRADVRNAAEKLDYFAGLVTEMKGDSVPVGPHAVNFSVREPLGVAVRIAAFNHPFSFVAGKMAAPLAAGNAMIAKPARQAPLSALRLAQLALPHVPPGVFNVLPGDRDTGDCLVRHPGVAIVGLIGSVPTGKAVMGAGAQTLKRVILELGGKNALIAYPDADPEDVAEAIVSGMNFSWCGQSCGSTSRLFVHESLHEKVLARLPEKCARFVPGLPDDPATTMGSLISSDQFQRVLDYIALGKSEGARLVYGGTLPDDPKLSKGFFIRPTIFDGVEPHMRIAREEIFGPVLCVLKWADESEMIRAVNSLEYGLTCSIWTNDLNVAHRAAAAVQAGYVWINQVTQHFLGAPFGGYKQSGIGREECLDELLAFTQIKNIHIALRQPPAPARRA